VVNLDRLFTAYTIKVTSKQTPPWVPVQVFDDGSRTYIRFAEDLRFTASPAVFAVHADRTPAPIDFSPYTSPQGDLTYVVNGLHPLLWLRGVDGMEVTLTRGSLHAR
jgi:type IV secretory pathway VirB9-like protein